jgi:hypothetical protein
MEEDEGGSRFNVKIITVNHLIVIPPSLKLSTFPFIGLIIGSHPTFIHLLFIKYCLRTSRPLQPIIPPAQVE